MPTKKLNLNELKKIRQELTNTIEVVSTKAGEARDANKIDDRQWQEARDEWGKLETQESALQALIDKLKLDFILDSKVDILQATEKLNKAAQKIDNFDNFLSEIGKVGGIVASTITAIQTGGLLTFPT